MKKESVDDLIVNNSNLHCAVTILLQGLINKEDPNKVLRQWDRFRSFDWSQRKVSKALFVRSSVKGRPYTRRTEKDKSMVVFERCLGAIPSNWVDPILTGPKSVLGNPPYSCVDIEKVLNAVRARVEKLKPK